MKIIAHRGFSEIYPENTILAFKKALELGVDGIETDLRLSSDGEAIVFHDSNLRRMTGYDKKVELLTLSEIKKFTIGDGEKIPSLDELLKLVDNKATLILEIKYNPTTYEKLCKIIEQSIKDKLKWVEVSCFEDKVLEYMYELNPKVKLHKLIDKAYELTHKDFQKKYSYASYFDIDVKLAKTVLDLDLFKDNKIIFWTVDKEDINKEIEAGLYGVMKNNPKL